MITKVREGEKYLLHWRKNPSTWNDNLKDLIETEKVIRINKQYYTIVISHYTGSYSVVDCTCDNKGNVHPIMVCNLKETYD